MLYYSLLAGNSDTTIVPNNCNHTEPLNSTCLLVAKVLYLATVFVDPDNESWKSSQETLVPEEFEPENG